MLEQCSDSGWQTPPGRGILSVHGGVCYCPVYAVDIREFIRKSRFALYKSACKWYNTVTLRV